MKESARMRGRERKEEGGRLKYEVIQKKVLAYKEFWREISTERGIVPRLREKEGIDSESFGLNAEGTKSQHRKRENEREKERMVTRMGQQLESETESERKMVRRATERG